jgi:hypothetical protein
LIVHLVGAYAFAADGDDAILSHGTKRGTIKAGEDDGNNARRGAETLLKISQSSWHYERVGLPARCLHMLSMKAQGC